MNIQNRTIFTGDNLPILRGLEDESIDLIYLDPPFNSNKAYSAPIGSQAAGAAFKDAWTFEDTDAEWWGQLSDNNPALYSVIHAAGEVGGEGDKAYLIYMAVRLLELHRVLKPTGNLYLHCDPTMSHALKLILDAIFGKKNYKNEIIWHYRTYQGRASNYYPKKHDVIFWYQRSSFKADKAPFCLEYKDNYQETVDYKRWKKFYVNQNQIKYGQHPKTDVRFTAYLKQWQKKHGRKPQKNELVYTCRGYVVDDVWVDIQAIDPKDTTEKQGYPTQKPEALLQRIIQASSNPGDMVLDPFCGCATTCVAAEKLGRQWVGIDISAIAAKLVKQRLNQKTSLSSEERSGKNEQLGLLGQVIHRIDIPPKNALTPTKDIKHRLYGLQEGKCKGCRIHFPFRNMTTNPIQPTHKGGVNTNDNLQLLCNYCNSLKGNRPMEYLLVELKKKGLTSLSLSPSLDKKTAIVH